MANGEDVEVTSNGGRSLQRKSTTQASALVAADMTRRMICGGLAGMIAKTATNPLERIKMLSQTGEHYAAGNASKQVSTAESIIGLYRQILKHEGILGLWAGNGANLLRVFPAKAVVFSSNDAYKSLFRKLTGASDDQPLRGSLAFLAGGLSGMTATAVTYPLDFARGRISGKLALEGGKKDYNGIIRTVILTLRDEGFFALYKGVTPTLLGAMPYEGIKFGTVGLLERLFPREDHQQNQNQGPLRKMIFGGVGGVMAGLITYPNDTVRRLLQLQGSRGTTAHYDGYWDCVQKTYKAHGIQRFYSGITINLIRMAPNAAVQFGSYEILKQWSAA